MGNRIKTHLAVTSTRASVTLTTTLCGAMSGKCDDGINSTERPLLVTCLKCQRIMNDPKNWRHRKFLAVGAQVAA